MRYAFAGDRDIAVAVLDFLIGEGARPEALLLSGPERASHAEALRSRCDHLDGRHVFHGAEFREQQALDLLRGLDLDFIIGIHFPYLLPPEFLSIPRRGVVNLHPAFLPWNRGWHTPSWALLDETPIGATLHFMDESVDTGAIIHQRALTPTPGDTADSLYARLKRLELDVFREAWPELLTGAHAAREQDPDDGTFHRRRDLFTPAVQQIELDAPVAARMLLRRLRALTTDRPDEAAYFEEGEKRYRVQVTITEEPLE